MKINDRDFNLNTHFNLPYWWRRYLFVLLALLIILFLAYHNSFDCSWHFDDYDNITQNNNIQIKQFSWENVKKISFGIINSNRISRPVSYLSFALNYYFGGLDVFGYHVVNFLIHYLCAIFLFLFIINTLKLPLLKEKYKKHSYSIALLATLFWAINPVHVTAVTYIVQRMASMAALFYILTMYCYLKFRTSDKKVKPIIFAILCVIFTILAIGTKENAAMLPVSIILYDLFFIQGLTRKNIRKNIKIAIFPSIILIVVGLLFYDVSNIINDYSIRPFSMTERLLTEPRIIIFYLSLLFYPVTPRLTLIHDIEISRSLFEPWTTFTAIMAIIIIIGLCAIKSRKYPLLTYCVLFFFINHFIEGSFLPLELIFEHRNYLPSMFLFVPFAILLVKGLEYFYNKKIIFYLISTSIIFLLIIQSVAVCMQNYIMKNEFSLWSDNVAKAPRLHSPRQSLALALLAIGDFSEALKELNIAITSFESGAFPKKALTYSCIGECYFFTGDDDKAVSFYIKSLNVYPPWSHKPMIFDRLASILMRKNLLDKAEEMARKAISLNPRGSGYYLTYCAILIKKKKLDAAIKKAQTALKLNPDSLVAYRYIADAYALKKNKTIENHFRIISKYSSL